VRDCVGQSLNSIPGSTQEKVSEIQKGAQRANQCISHIRRKIVCAVFLTSIKPEEYNSAHPFDNNLLPFSIFPGSVANKYQ